MMYESSLYDELPALKRTLEVITERLYYKMQQHPVLGSIFKNSNIETLKKHQTQFLCSLFGSESPYEGESITEVHKNYDINHPHIDIWIDCVRESMEEAGIDEKTILKMVELINTQRSLVVNDVHHND